MTIKPLRSHTYMPARQWDTPYLINTWSGNYERYDFPAYEPAYDRLYGGIVPYRATIPINVAELLACAA